MCVKVCCVRQSLPKKPVTLYYIYIYNLMYQPFESANIGVSLNNIQFLNYLLSPCNFYFIYRFHFLCHLQSDAVRGSFEIFYTPLSNSETMHVFKK